MLSIDPISKVLAVFNKHVFFLFMAFTACSKICILFHYVILFHPILPY